MTTSIVPYLECSVHAFPTGYHARNLNMWFDYAIISSELDYRLECLLPREVWSQFIKRESVEGLVDLDGTRTGNLDCGAQDNRLLLRRCHHSPKQTTSMKVNDVLFLHKSSMVLAVLKLRTWYEPEPRPLVVARLDSRSTPQDSTVEEFTLLFNRTAATFEKLSKSAFPIMLPCAWNLICKDLNIYIFACFSACSSSHHCLSCCLKFLFFFPVDVLIQFSLGSFSQISMFYRYFCLLLLSSYSHMGG